ncbi:MAG: polyprenyl synthetase family protein [Thermoguttaceae bacterium]|nr:polyprenyl synthetase family protein [Thermoguttaceae bacterium]MDW8038895.1 polyprenyl synthetase family protein [Thermoguttaceae bacterium]
MHEPFEQYARQIGPTIEGALKKLVAGVPGCPEILQEAMEYALLGPGKRLRPMLVLLAAEACGADPVQALPAACAVEMVHAYSLVHDDLPAMDNDDLRRGRPTCHKVFGDAMAILAGDALLTLAFETLAKGVQPPERAATCCAVLAEAAGRSGLVGGQVDDLVAQKHPSLPSKVFSERTCFAGAQNLSSHFQGTSSPRENELSTHAHPPNRGQNTPIQDSSIASLLEYLESIHRRKTGAMILASLRLGAVVAGAAESQHQMLAHYGQALGLAFQIVDDLLDVQGEESQVGKRLRKDAMQGKLTFPGLLGQQESLQRAQQLVAEAVQAIAPMGPRASRLQSLAYYVLQRSR